MVEGESVCTVTDPNTHLSGLTRTCMHTYQADEDNERVDEAALAELRPDEEKIMDRALAALDHISKSGGANFTFDKRAFFKSHLRQKRTRWYVPG